MLGILNVYTILSYNTSAVDTDEESGSRIDDTVEERRTTHLKLLQFREYINTNVFEWTSKNVIK